MPFSHMRDYSNGIIQFELYVGGFRCFILGLWHSDIRLSFFFLVHYSELMHVPAQSICGDLLVFVLICTYCAFCYFLCIF